MTRSARWLREPWTRAAARAAIMCSPAPLPCPACATARVSTRPGLQLRARHPACARPSTTAGRHAHVREPPGTARESISLRPDGPASVTAAGCALERAWTRRAPAGVRCGRAALAGPGRDRWPLALTCAERTRRREGAPGGTEGGPAR